MAFHVKQYLFAGEPHGLFVEDCLHCSKPVVPSEQDYVTFTRTRRGDWEYGLMHRSCWARCGKEDGWKIRQEQERKTQAKYDRKLQAVRNLMAQLRISDPFELADLAYEAAGQNIEEIFGGH